LLAARANKKVITMAEIKEATFKVVMGPEKKSRVMSEKEKRLTAYHEAGHAIAIKEVSTTDRVDRISIIPSVWQAVLPHTNQMRIKIMRPSPILLKRLSLHWRKSGRGDCAG